jgi:hypothetical protein
MRRFMTITVLCLSFAACAPDVYVRCHDSRCSACNGRGSYRCGFCGGSGGRPCPSCNRSGFVSRVQTDPGSIAYGHWATVPCPDCHGRMKVACNHCNGDGQADCGRWADLREPLPDADLPDVVKQMMQRMAPEMENPSSGQ